MPWIKCIVAESRSGKPFMHVEKVRLTVETFFPSYLFQIRYSIRFTKDEFQACLNSVTRFNDETWNEFASYDEYISAKRKGII